MMKKKPSVILYHTIKLGVYLAFAILIFFFRVSIVESHLKYFIGSLMLLYGIEEMVFSIIYFGSNFLHEGKVYLGFVEILFGFSLIFAPLEFEVVCIVWATWSIVRESYEVKEIITELRYIIPKLISGIETIAVIILSIMLIIEPGENHAYIHLYLLLLELPFNPLVPLLDELIYKYHEKQLN